MSKIETLLFDKSNAVLATNEDRVIAIISCDKNEDITEKVKLAIKEEYIAKEAIIFPSNEEQFLTSDATFFFHSEIIDEEDDMFVEDFNLTIHATY